MTLNRLVADDEGGEVSEPTPLTEGDFDAWVRPHLAVLVAVAERQVGRTHRDDVVQETVLRAWQKRSTYRADRGDARSWLLAILFDQARRFRTRDKQASATSYGPSAETARIEPAPPDDLEALYAALDRLPARQRQVVTLFYLADLPVTHIGAVLGIRVSTVTSHLDQARRRLARELGDSNGHR